MLHIAAREGHTRMCGLLLARRADPNVQTILVSSETFLLPTPLLIRRSELRRLILLVAVATQLFANFWPSTKRILA